MDATLFAATSSCEHDRSHTNGKPEASARDLSHRLVPYLRIPPRRIFDGLPF